MYTDFRENQYTNQEPAMRFGRYVLTVLFEDDTLLPKYLGSTLRGAFGASLKTSLCGNLARACESCRIAARCLYARTFEPRSFAGDTRLHGGIEPPPAYVIEPPTGHPPRLGKGDTLAFTLLLFGEANSYVPFFLNAFEVMGRRGISRRVDESGRGMFSLHDVHQKEGHSLFDNSTGRLMGQPVVRHMRMEPLPDGNPLDLKVALQTPLRLKFHNQLRDTLPFHVLVRAALRRISSVFAFHGDGSPDLDYKHLVAAANSVQICSSQLQWLDWERYSNRQKRRMLLGGMVGSVRYASVPRIYHPILETGSVLHLGKQSTFGLGKLTLHWSDTEQDQQIVSSRDAFFIELANRL
jgi:hypothetical protein